jgi:hypothetical protein
MRPGVFVMMWFIYDPQNILYTYTLIEKCLFNKFYNFLSHVLAEYLTGENRISTVLDVNMRLGSPFTPFNEFEI